MPERSSELRNCTSHCLWDRCPPRATGSSNETCAKPNSPPFQPSHCLSSVPSSQWLSAIRRHLASSSSYLFRTHSHTQSVNKSCLLCLQLSAVASRDAATMVCCCRNDPASPYLGSRPPPSSAPPPPTSHAAAGMVSLSEPQKEAHHWPDDRIESKIPNTIVPEPSHLAGLQPTLSTFIAYLFRAWHVLPVSRVPFLSYSA